MSCICYKAPGKVILSGEHAVVYGKPALATGIQKYCTVTVKKVKTTPSSQHPALKHLLKEVITYLRSQKIMFEQVSFDVEIDHDLPYGRGLGSSAALAVATSAGLYELFTGNQPSKETINTLAYKGEKFFNGNPSGVDNTTACYGGLLFFRKEFEFLKTISSMHAKIPKPIENNLYLIDSGKPAETTAEMVERVKHYYNRYPKKADMNMYEIEKVSKRMLVSIMKEDTTMFKQCLEQNNTLLQKIGIVSSHTKQFLSDLTSLGVGKVTGAGGKTKGSGYILFYADNPEELKEYCNTNGISYFPLKQDYNGVVRI